MKVFIIYWSGSGNTEEMASYIKKGGEEAGAEVSCHFVSDMAPEEVKDCDRIALGCPSMGDEVLEEGEMEPFVSAIETWLQGKSIGLFGSYGWGNGKWMRDWAERMERCGVKLIRKPIICQGGPDADCAKELIELGKALAKE